MTPKPIRIEGLFNAPIAKLWQALTNKAEMKLWYFDIAAFEPEIDFEFEFTAGTDEKKYRHLCKVTTVIPGNTIAYNWRYDGYEGNSNVCFELSEAGTQTKLTLTHAGLESFPESNPDFAKENFVAGWTHIIGIGLKVFVETP